MSGATNIRLACPDCFRAGDDYWLLMPQSQMEIGAPLCPVHECHLWTDEDFRIAKDLKRQARENKPLNLCQFISHKGGMTKTPDLEQILARHHMTAATSYIRGGRGRLMMAKGALTVASAMEAAMEAGYLSEDSYEGDFYDAIDETLEGRACYSANDIGAAAEFEYMERHAI